MNCDIMERTFRQKQVEISFQKFGDYSRDVLSANFHTFPARFDILMHHCETDEIMRVICLQLREYDAHFQEWWESSMKTGGSMIGSKKFSLPLDETERDALLYQLCLKIQKGEIKLDRYCMDFFGETNFNRMIYAFNDAILKLLLRSIGYRLENILDLIKTDLTEREPVPFNMFLIYQDHSLTIGHGNEFTGDAAIGSEAKIER